MFYKVIKNEKVIDVLDNLTYLKWQPKHRIMVLCSEDKAQAILSSDKNSIWHERTLYKIPEEAGHYETVSIEEIDKFEYEQLKMLNCRSPEEIVDEMILYMVNNHII